MRRTVYRAIAGGRDAGGDPELVRASRRGNQAAFRELVDRYYRRILAVATGMLRNREDALDVAQETFVKAYQNLADFKGDSAFYTWLYRIAVNLCIDLQRRESRYGRFGARGEASAADPEAGVEGHADGETRDEPFEQVKDRELGARVLAAIDELTPDHRAVILLREVQGLSYDEISQVMQCAKGTVMSRLHYARKNLQARLRDLL
jgi:RNA polymerase sigma-70 factor (ECF subfamily)